MKISKFNKRIGFYTQRQVPTKGGDMVTKDILAFECWAAVKEQYASEINNTVGTVLEDSVQFLIRANFEIQNSFIVLYKERRYQIIKIVDDPLNNKHTTVFAKKVG